MKHRNFGVKPMNDENPRVKNEENIEHKQANAKTCRCQVPNWPISLNMSS